MKTQSREGSLTGETVYKGYGNDSSRLPYYWRLIAVYVTAFAAGTTLARRRRKLPERIEFSDLLLMGVATHKISRLASKDRVTAPLRAPFTQFVKPTGSSEVEEVGRGPGMRGAIGELITCPYCVSSWAALSLVLGYTFRPRATRLVCSTMTAITISHLLNQIYAVLKKKSE